MTWDRDGLLLKLNMIQCCALDQDGNQCPRPARSYIRYHGDSELYSGFNRHPTWVQIAMCEECCATFRS